MNQRQWRNPEKRKCGLCGTQWPAERFELVEALITANRRASVAERSLRDLANDRTGDPALGSLLAAKEARIVDLEDIVSRLNQSIASGRKKAS